MTSTAQPGDPTKVMAWEEFYDKTDNAEKLMDRVWYCIAASDASVAEQKIFWEHWYWKEGSQGSDDGNNKDLDKKECCNHTKTISVDGKEMDYPIWPVTFSKTSMKMFPAIDCKCFVIAPIGLSMTPVQFPTNDSRTEFRVDYASVFGKKMYFIFTLDPLISEEHKDLCYETLEKEHGVLREWFHEIKWPKDYEIGSAGEPDINPR